MNNKDVLGDMYKPIAGRRAWVRPAEQVGRELREGRRGRAVQGHRTEGVGGVVRRVDTGPYNAEMTLTTLLATRSY